MQLIRENFRILIQLYKLIFCVFCFSKKRIDFAVSVFVFTLSFIENL